MNVVFALQNTEKHQKFLSYNNRQVLVIDHQYAINTSLAAKHALPMPKGAMTRITAAYDAKGTAIFLKSNVLTILRVEGVTLTPGEAFIHEDANGASYWVYALRDDKKSGYLVNFTPAVIESVFAAELETKH